MSYVIDIFIEQSASVFKKILAGLVSEFYQNARSNLQMTTGILQNEIGEKSESSQGLTEARSIDFGRVLFQ